MDDDLTMLIGAATDGALLEVGVFDIEGDDPVAQLRDAVAAQVLQVPLRGVKRMRHTDEEIERAAERFEGLADELDPGGCPGVRAT